MGDRLPADHNYRLYSALISKLPILKRIDWQLGTITGIPDHSGWVKLGQFSTLSIRCEFANLGIFSALDNDILRVGQSLIKLGQSEGNSLHPYESLIARIVTVKARDIVREDPFLFGVSIGKQLQALGIQSIPKLGDRKTIRVKDHTIVGYSLSFPYLSPYEALILQSKGVGGRRKIGAGYFIGVDPPRFNDPPK